MAKAATSKKSAKAPKKAGNSNNRTMKFLDSYSSYIYNGISGIKRYFGRYLNRSPFSSFQLERVLNVHDATLNLLGTIDSEPTILIIQNNAMLSFTKNPAATFLSLLNSENSTAKLHHANDVYNNFVISCDNKTTSYKVTMIRPASSKHIEKYSSQAFRIITESPEDFENITLPIISASPVSKHQWVLNILEGKSEADSVLISDPDFMLVPDTKWKLPHDSSNASPGLYCLAIVQAKFAHLKTLRDLKGSEHLELLQSMKKKSLDYIKTNFDLDENQMRLFVHYHPSYYHFHIHICHVSFPYGIAVGKAFLLNEIINNLKVDPMYYQNATMSYLVGQKQNREVYEAYVKG